MKTPRQILFERHRAADSKLDVVRQNALAELAERPARESRKQPLPTLRELIMSLRWHLAGLSAVWLIVALLSIDHTPSPVASNVKGNVPSPRQFLTALRENREQLLELIEPATAETSDAPRRRSEIQPLTGIA